MSASLQTAYDKIYKYCYFKVKNKELAEDLTQEAFLKYFSQKGYISHGKPLAYLYTIARNQCIDYFRQKKTEPLGEDFPADCEENTVLTNLAVSRAVESLSSEFREIILLRFASQLTMGEISQALGISRFAGYRKINAALKALKQMLREEDFYE